MISFVNQWVQLFIFECFLSAAVEQLKGKEVKIFAIGVGKATVTELKKLAYTGEKSNTKDVFYADNYKDAKRFTDTLVSLICKNV